jgi:hypothetical protein
MKNTNSERFGTYSIQHNLDYRKRYKIDNNPFYIKPLFGGVSLFQCDCNQEHNFEISVVLYHSRFNNKIPLCTVCNPISETRSFKEKDLFEFIRDNYSGEIIQSYRDGLEIDIYLHELKLGFEFNGIYWHSEVYKDKNYHLNKLNYFKESEIRVVNIWEDDWVNKNEIIKSQVKNLLNLSFKVYARKCEVKEIIQKNIVYDFLNRNHIQGSYKQIQKCYGLYFNQELISVMTFDHFEGRKKMSQDEWNLSRFCTKLNTVVIGGASKLLNFFLKNNGVSRIISYADKDWSLGNLYETLGFCKLYETKPDYKYIVNDVRIHKSNLRKKKGQILTESQANKHIPKIYDCGKIKYQKLN